MDGRGGCCIARHVAGSAMYDMSKVDRIMLRFRPIAPKPTAIGSVSGASTTPLPDKKDSRTKPARGGGKRRYAKDGESNSGARGGRRCCKKRKTAAPAKASGSEEENYSSEKTESGGSTVSSVETLPLLPEKPEQNGSKSPAKKRKQNDSIWFNFGRQNEFQPPPRDTHVTGPVKFGSSAQAVTVVGSWVRVERVTSTWVDGYNNLGRTDQERMMNLDRDTCPGFVSDGLNRVRWANRAYKDLAAVDGGDVAVWLVMADGVRLPTNTSSFTCRVKVVTCGSEKNSKILLCDVWRMDRGGFAWRLDTKAALSLGFGQ